MSRSFLTLALLCLAAMAAARAAPASVESVEQLLVLARAPALVERMQADAEEAMLGRGLVRTPEPVLPAPRRIAREQMPMRVRALIHEEINWERFKPLFVQAYRDTFQQAEIDGLIAFYRTPLGQAYAEKVPMAARRFTDATQPAMQRVWQKWQALQDETSRQGGVTK